MLTAGNLALNSTPQGHRKGQVLTICAATDEKFLTTCGVATVRAGPEFWKYRKGTDPDAFIANKAEKLTALTGRDIYNDDVKKLKKQ